MNTLAALFPVARPQGAASVFLVPGAVCGAASGAEARARLAEAVALAFAAHESASPLGPSRALARL